MERLILFGILSIPVAAISWRTLFNMRSHGFYRFFSWELIIWLFVSNYTLWFAEPFSLRQIVSWVFLIFSAYVAIAGVMQLKKSGKHGNSRIEKELYRFERTTGLVDKGIYKYLRHPLYSSLLFLTWGIFLKNPTGTLIIIALLSSVFLFLTAIFEEKECISVFGEQYADYMKRSKRFVPFIF